MVGATGSRLGPGGYFGSGGAVGGGGSGRGGNISSGAVNGARGRHSDPVDLGRLASRFERPAPQQPALELVCAALDRAALDRPALELQLTLR